MDFVSFLGKAEIGVEILAGIGYDDLYIVFTG